MLYDSTNALGFGAITSAFKYLLIGAFLWICAGWAAVAQSSPPPALIADQVRYDANSDSLIATGNVQIFFENRVLEASKVEYQNATGQIVADGPLTLRDGNTTTILGSSAEIDGELRSALLYGARLVLAENFQFAADKARKVNDRFTVLDRSVASACQICNRDDVPVWLIRARRIVHDAETRTVHFEGARFEFLGVPIAYFPYFRTPDPSVERASGFLTPQFKSSDIYGFGFRIPYYFVIDANRDLTVTPFLTTSGAKILEGEFRQRFYNGDLDFTGAIAFDTDPDVPATRAFIDGTAEFDLRNDYRLNLELNWVSDDAFLSEYGYSSADRLTSSAQVSKQTDSSYFKLETVGFQSLRDGVDDRTLPVAFPRISFENYWTPQTIGGRAGIEADARALVRLDGRDVASAGGTASWQASTHLAGGILGSLQAQMSARAYVTGDDPAYPDTAQFIGVPALSAELRWPFSRVSKGTTQVIEPVFQIVYSESWGDTSGIPNEDSADLEFDAANLFSINRFPGDDRFETGLRANVGLSFNQFSDTGWNYGITIGQVFRQKKSSEFPGATGLNDLSSNFVAATNIDFPPYFSVSNQTILSNSFDFERNDIQMTLALDTFELDASYVYLSPDGSLTTGNGSQELRFEGRYQATPNWAIDVEWRRDLAGDDDVTAGAGIEYGNECVRSRFSVSRRFTNSNSLSESTEFGFTVSLAGLGGATEDWPAQNCVAP